MPARVTHFSRSKVPERGYFFHPEGVVCACVSHLGPQNAEGIRDPRVKVGEWVGGCGGAGSGVPRTAHAHDAGRCVPRRHPHAHTYTY